MLDLDVAAVAGLSSAVNGHIHVLRFGLSSQRALANRPINTILRHTVSKKGKLNTVWALFR